ncbi:hypothetical protein DFH29DRAFT_1027855 [Suillus ampliporus]|nr:hypothetical protein DFH29DRAFT_1027855 [Suillus ampliporus]
MSEAEEITTAEAPFDNLHGDSDITLRSTNSVDFHVFKLVLSLVSPVFKDMFTLPQNGLQSNVLSAPIIPVAESSTTLKSLLLLCYPAATPTFDSVGDAKAVLEAARKYDMQAALSRAGDLIIAQFLPQHPLDMYALSCQFGWQHHAQTAATKALEIKDLGRPSNGFNVSLLRRLGCLYWLGSSSGGTGTGAGGAGTGTSTSTRHIANVGQAVIARWFDEYLVSSGKELLARPCGSTLLESAHYNNAIVQATGCTSCRGTVVGIMDKFRALYIAQVDKVVATVKLKEAS